MLRRVTRRRHWLVLAGGVLMCLRCLLLPAVVAVTGVAALTALGGWLAGHAVLVALGVSGALVSLAIAARFALTRTRAPACSAEEASEL